MSYGIGFNENSDQTSVRPNQTLIRLVDARMELTSYQTLIRLLPTEMSLVQTSSKLLL